MRYPARIVVYLAVIAIAPALQDPWMAALQAGLGGLMLGIRIEQWRIICPRTV